MLPKQKSSIRSSSPEDIPKLKMLLKSEQMVHKHLDWRHPLDRISESPFLIMERSGRIIGALACPADPPKTAWIQLFLSVSGESSKVVWTELFVNAISALKKSSAKNMLSIPINPWFTRLLKDTGFSEISNVIVFNLDTRNFNKQIPESTYIIRDMESSDILQIETLDNEAFGPVWHNTNKSLQAALNQAYKATVALDGEKIIGYQISTISRNNIHLARLAVDPEYQSKGVGSACLNDLIRFLKSRDKDILSVNTQQNNPCSKNLYSKFGFEKTNEHFPVFGLNLYGV